MYFYKYIYYDKCECINWREVNYIGSVLLITSHSTLYSLCIRNRKVCGGREERIIHWGQDLYEWYFCVLMVLHVMCQLSSYDNALTSSVSITGHSATRPSADTFTSSTLRASNTWVLKEGQEKQRILSVSFSITRTKHSIIFNKTKKQSRCAVNCP